MNFKDNYLTEVEVKKFTPHDNIIESFPSPVEDRSFISDNFIFQKYKNFVVIWNKYEDFTLLKSKPIYNFMGVINIDDIPRIIRGNEIDPNISDMLHYVYKKLNKKIYSKG